MDYTTKEQGHIIIHTCVWIAAYSHGYAGIVHQMIGDKAFVTWINLGKGNLLVCIEDAIKQAPQPRSQSLDPECTEGQQ